MTNLDLASRFVDASERRDAEELGRLIAEDAVWDMSRSRGPYTGVYHGHEDIRKLLLGVTEAWEEMRFERTGAYEVGDWLAEGISAKMRGRGSGVELEARGARVYHFREGQIVRFVLCQDMDEAKALVDEAQP